MGALVICLMGSGVAAVKPLEGSSLSTQADRGRAAPPGASARRDCPDARRGLAYYRHQAAWWRSKMGQERVGTVSRESHVRQGASQSCPYIRLWASRWRERAHRARLAYERWYAWAWREWLPANWIALARCETGLRFDWDSGSYVSAFGIYRPGYADDAHRIGHLSWDETKRRLHRLPTPREQYEAALSHYRMHGDGWGCPGP